MKKKPIYAVHCTTTFGVGLQYVKASSEEEAIKKFKSRNKKSQVIEAELTDKQYHPRAI